MDNPSSSLPSHAPSCGACGKPEGPFIKLQRCGGCPAATAPRYCSKECQMAAWKGGHRKECHRIVGQSNAAAGGDAALEGGARGSPYQGEVSGRSLRPEASPRRGPLPAEGSGPSPPVMSTMGDEMGRGEGPPSSSSKDAQLGPGEIQGLVEDLGSSSEERQERAARTLSDRPEASLASAGGAEALVRALSVVPPISPRFLFHCIDCLFMMDSKEGRAAVKAAGGIPALLRQFRRKDLPSLEREMTVVILSSLIDPFEPLLTSCIVEDLEGVAGLLVNTLDELAGWRGGRRGEGASGGTRRGIPDPGYGPIGDTVVQLLWNLSQHLGSGFVSELRAAGAIPALIELLGHELDPSSSDEAGIPSAAASASDGPDPTAKLLFFRSALGLLRNALGSPPSARSQAEAVQAGVILVLLRLLQPPPRCTGHQNDVSVQLEAARIYLSFPLEVSERAVLELEDTEEIGSLFAGAKATLNILGPRVRSAAGEERAF